MEISYVTLALILAYVSWLAFSVGRLYEQLRQTKREAAKHRLQSDKSGLDTGQEVTPSK